MTIFKNSREAAQDVTNFVLVMGSAPRHLTAPIKTLPPV
jgi:hypothetical protein